MTSDEAAAPTDSYFMTGCYQLGDRAYPDTNHAISRVYNLIDEAVRT